MPNRGALFVAGQRSFWLPSCNTNDTRNASYCSPECQVRFLWVFNTIFLSLSLQSHTTFLIFFYCQGLVILTVNIRQVEIEGKDNAENHIEL